MRDYLLSPRGGLHLAGLWLVACLLLGGGTRQGLSSDSLLQLLAAPMLLLAAWRLQQQTLDRWMLAALALVALLLLWLLLQLLPLPPAWWSSLPGRAALAADLALAGMAETARPISLDVESSRRALLAWLPVLAMGALAWSLDRSGRERLLRLLLGLAVVSVLLGLAQLMAGPDSGLRWQPITNVHNAVGSFANRNHFAALLVLGLVMAGAWLADRGSVDGARRVAQRVAASIAAALLLLGLAIAASRAGVGLALVAVLGIAALVWRARFANPKAGQGSRRWLAAAVLLGLVAGVQFGFYGVMQRFEKDPLEDARWILSENTLQAARHFGLLGTGAGTFPLVYRAREPELQIGHAYINRAHNDWAEWWLEGGVPLAILLFAGLALLAAATLRAWRLQRTGSVWPAAASLGLWLLLAHSLADYPLRTTALASIAALLVVVTVQDGRPRRALRRQASGNSPRDRDAD